MLSESQYESLKAPLRVTQIIVIAMALGVFIFLGVVMFVLGAKPSLDTPIITYAGAAGAVAAVVGAIVVPGLITASMQRAMISPVPSRPPSAKGASDGGDAVRRLAQAFQTLTIIRCALLEGAAFFNVVAFMLEGRTLALIVSGVLWLLLLMQMPTMSRLESWVESKLAEIDPLGQLR